MSVNGLVNSSVPILLQKQKMIELSIGENFYFIRAPGTHSVKFEKLIRNVDDFISFVEAGPERSVFKFNIKFYISQPDLILCQPSLSSHAVLTSTLGVSFVW